LDDPLSDEGIDRSVARAWIELLRHIADSVTTGGDDGHGSVRLHRDR
jgi:hypothetical protein